VYWSQDEYTGEWRSDLPHGWGRCAYHAGYTYEGEFENGEKHGTVSIESCT
jgi:hypothetical protein